MATSPMAHVKDSSEHEAVSVWWSSKIIDTPSAFSLSHSKRSDDCMSRVERRRGIIRARALGESVELVSADEGSADEHCHCPSGGRRRRFRHSVARSWSHLVAWAGRFIGQPWSSGSPAPEDTSGGGSGGGMLVNGASVNARASKGDPPVGFWEGLRLLLRAAFWDIIHPDSVFRTGWDLTIVLLLFYVAFVTTYLLAFEFEADGHLSAFEVIDIVINCFFLFDILLNFRTGLRKGDDAVSRTVTPITSRRVIALNYIMGWLVIDVLAGVPWGQVTANLGSYMQLLKLLRLARLLRLFTMSKLMQRSRMYQSMQYRQGVAALRLATYVGVALLILHLSASAWFFTAVMENKNLVGTWAEAAGLDNEGGFQRYLTSLYFVVITFTTVGYGDVTPVTTAERFMACVGMLMGVVTLGYIISTANTIMGNANKYEIAKDAMRSRAAAFLKERQLPPALASRVKDYYAHVSKRQFNEQGDVALVASLPGDLRRDVLRGLHSGLISQVPFFGSAFERHEELVLDLTAALKLEYFGKRECVVMEGGWDTEMYFVTEGSLIVRQYILSLDGPGGETAAVTGPGQDGPHKTHQQGQQHQLAGGETEWEEAEGRPPSRSTTAPPRNGVGDPAALAGVSSQPWPLPASAVALVASSGNNNNNSGQIGVHHPPPGPSGPPGAAPRSNPGHNGGDRSASQEVSTAVRQWLVQAADAAADTTAAAARAAAAADAAGGGDGGGGGGLRQEPGMKASSAVQAVYGGREGGALQTSSGLTLDLPSTGEPAGVGASALSPGEQSELETGTGMGLGLAAPVPFEGGVAVTHWSGRAGRYHPVPGSTGTLQQQGQRWRQTEGVEGQHAESSRRRWRLHYDERLHRDVRQLKEKDYFGEYSCLTGCPRTATVVTKRMTELYSLARADLRAAMCRWPALQAAWQAFQAYGDREREKLRQCLPGGRAPLAMSLDVDETWTAAGGGGGDEEGGAGEGGCEEAAYRSEERYRDFLRHFQGGGDSAAGGGPEGGDIGGSARQ